MCSAVWSSKRWREPQEQLQFQGVRELRGTAEAAVRRVETPPQGRQRVREQVR